MTTHLWQTAPEVPAWQQAPPVSAGNAELTQGDTAPMMSRGIIERGHLAAPNLVVARASLAPDPRDQIKRYAEHFKQPVSEFGIVNGEIVRWVPEENAFAKVVPTIGGGVGVAGKTRGLLGQTASGLGPVLPSIAGGAVGAAVAPTGASIPTVGAVAGATDWARQTLDRALAGESLLDIDWGNVAGQAGLNLGGQALGVGTIRALTRNPLNVAAYDRLTAASIPEQAKWTALEAEARKRGVELSVGQKTNLRSIMAMERLLGRYPETADRVADFVRQQRQVQVPRAVEAQLGAISPPAGREAQIQAFRTGADEVVAGALNERQAEARIAYAKALDNKPAVWTPDLWTLMDRPSVKRAWGKAQELAAERNEKLPQLYLPDESGNLILDKKVVPDWRSWDYIKRGLDAVIEDNTNALGRVNALGASVRGTKRELLGILDRENPAYKAARQKYGTASDAVDTILEGGVGFIKNMDGMARQNIVSRVFSGGNLLPEEVARMRGQFKVTGHLPDWNAGLRAFVEGKLDDAMKATATGGEAANVPGKIYKDLWGNPAQRKVMEAALGDHAAVEGFEKLMRVLQASSRVLPEGSPTATDLHGMAHVGTKGAVAGALTLAGKTMSPLTYFNLGNELVASARQLREPAQRIKMAEYLLSDDGLKRLRHFKLLSPTSQRSIIEAAQMLQQAAITGSGARIPADIEPPAARQQ